MSISSRITSIEEHIGDIYDTLELGGADLTNTDKNLVNVKPILKQKYLDYMNNGTREIWNNWEKVPTGTGENVTLNNTIQAPMDVTVKGNSEQVQYSGKNKFNQPSVTKLIRNGSSSTNGITNANDIITISYTNGQHGRYAMDCLMPITTGEVTVSFKALLTGTNDSKGILVSLYNSTATAEATTGKQLTATAKDNWYDYSTTFTLNSNAENGINLDIQAWNSGNTIQLNGIQVEIGSTATSYEPYVGGTASPNPSYPQEISNVTGDVEIAVGNGINILNMEKYAIENSTYFTYSSNTGLTAIAKDNRATANVGYPMTVTAGTTYYIKADTDKRILVSQYNSNNGWILNNEVYNEDYFVANNNASYIRVKIADTLTTFPTIIGNVYITTSNDYKEQIFTFPLGTQRMYLGDYLADDGIHHVRGQVTFNGSDDERIEKMFGNIYNGKCLYLLYQVHKQQAGAGLSNAFKEILGMTEFYPEGINFSYSNNAFGLIILSERINNNYTVPELKTWLSTHNVTVEYELATEEITPYTTEQQAVYNQIKQAKSYMEQTNISGSSDELETIFTVVALKNI